MHGWLYTYDSWNSCGNLQPQFVFEWDDFISMRLQKICLIWKDTLKKKCYMKWMRLVSHTNINPLQLLPDWLMFMNVTGIKTTMLTRVNHMNKLMNIHKNDSSISRQNYLPQIYKWFGIIPSFKYSRLLWHVALQNIFFKLYEIYPFWRVLKIFLVWHEKI